jgi:hypothetical protein
LLTVGIAALAFLAAGCSPPWQVVLQAVPDPFVAQRRFAVLPIDFTGLHIGKKSEVEYLAGKDADQQRSFAGDKEGMNAEFTKELLARAHAEGIEVFLATSPADGPYLIRPSVAFVEPGYYAVVMAGASKVEMTVRITAPDGRVLDEITLAHGSIARNIDINLVSSGGRLRNDAKMLGMFVAKYLKSRVEP